MNLPPSMLFAACVMRGLDPRIHADVPQHQRLCSMDCRVKPGNDDLTP